MASDKSSLVQIAQAVLDQDLQAIKIVNADPGAGGATEVTALDILTEVTEINDKTPALDAGNVPVDVKASVLPAGAATEATLLLVESAVDGLEMFTSETAANTLATAASVSSIDTKTPALVGGRVPVDVGASVLPTGAATEATLSSIDGKTPALVSGRVPVDGSGVTQPVSATNLDIRDLNSATDSVSAVVSGSVTVTATDLDIRDLSSATDSVSVPGVATAANQTTANTSLSNIDASLNDIEAVIEVVGHGSAATAQRSASMLGVGTTAVSDSNPVPTKLIQTNFGIPVHDYIGVSYPDGDTEIYTYRTGGSGGTVVSTVTVEYTDTTKTNILSVARS